jgi:hypothetical protein
MYKHTILLITIMVALMGCASDGQDALETYKSPEITFEPTLEYSLDTSKLDDLHEETLSGLLDAPIYANITDDGTMSLTFDDTEANAVLLYSEDYSKIADLAEITEGYRNIVMSQVELIKVKDSTIQALQQLVLLQQSSKEIYKENFVLADKLYRAEHKLRMREKVYGEIRFFSTILGIIAVGVI